MKNLPATIGLMIVLIVFFLFQGNPDRQLQATPVNQHDLAYQQDTFPPKPRDTIQPARQGKKKDWKKHHKDSTQRKDTMTIR